MNKCDCFRTQEKLQYLYRPFTGEPFPLYVTIGICYGTKERDECTCNGDRSKCDFYPEVREKEKRRISLYEKDFRFKNN